MKKEKEKNVKINRRIDSAAEGSRDEDSARGEEVKIEYGRGYVHTSHFISPSSRSDFATGICPGEIPGGPGFVLCSSKMRRIYDDWLEILKIQMFRRLVSYTRFFCFAALISYVFTNNTNRAGYSRADQFYASLPAGTELLADKQRYLYKAALGNCFEVQDWGSIEWSILAKHFERQGKLPYAYHAQYMAHLASQGQVDGS
ncbi:non-capsid protein NS-1 [Striga asiatica]|uniref:Non-capsid protein NS-1 n=1 Tax=Striga asiatica TaxID=4170 RepID=A0A5A7R2E9_STRAF|nr:non-capsid protein NS-1 [Striga asiatica]